MNVPTLDAIIRFLYHGSTLSDRQADEIIAFGEDMKIEKSCCS